jgi:hypothetical protein
MVEPDKLPITNADTDWGRFGSGYFAQYGDAVIGPDRGLARSAIGCLDTLGIPLGSLDRGFDIGVGGVARGPALIAPFVRDGGRIDWIDLEGTPQLEYTRRTIAAGREGDLAIWAQHQGDMGRFNPNWADAVRRACLLGEAVAGSVFNLPQNTYDIGGMWFVAESITEDPEEHRAALRRFFGSVKIGGVALVASMYGSTGWDSAGVPLPAVPIDARTVVDIAKEASYEGLQSYQVLADHGPSNPVRPSGSQFTYDSMGLVVGRRVA